jgi:hypothetical protein
MKLKLSKESSLHSSDYFELLNSIDIKSNILGNSKKGITRTQDGIILNPNFVVAMLVLLFSFSEKSSLLSGI